MSTFSLSKTHTKVLVFGLLTLALVVLLGINDAFAVVQIPDIVKPDAFDNIEIDPADILNGEGSEDVPSENKVTRVIILFVGRILSRVLLFAGTVAILFIIVAGFNYITAFGKDEKIEKGKRGLFWAVMGLFIIMMSYAIVQAIITALQQVDTGAFVR